jgi:hypothetical protein
MDRLSTVNLIRHSEVLTRYATACWYVRRLA